MERELIGLDVVQQIMIKRVFQELVDDYQHHIDELLAVRRGMFGSTITPSKDAKYLAKLYESKIKDFQEVIEVFEEAQRARDESWEETQRRIKERHEEFVRDLEEMG